MSLFQQACSLLVLLSTVLVHATETPKVTGDPLSNQLHASCEILGKLRDVESRQDTLTSIPDQKVFASFDYEGKPVHLTVADFGRNYVELLEERNIHTTGLFKFKLFSTGMGNLLERKAKYSELVKIKTNRIKDSNHKLSYCLAAKGKSFKALGKQNQAIFDTEFRPEALNAFIQTSVESAVRAKLLLEKLDELEIQEKKALKNSPLLSRYKPNSREKEYYDGPERLKIMQSFGESKAVFVAMLNVLKTDAGTILDVEHDMELTSLSLSRHILTLSDFSENLLKLFSSKDMKFLRAQTKGSLNRKTVIAAILLLPNLGKLESGIRARIADRHSSLMWEAQAAVANQLVRINESAANVCKQGAETLHHYDELVYETLRTNLVTPQTKNIIYRDLGAYCFLQDKFPKEERSIINWRTMSGLGLIGLGSALRWAGYLSIVGTPAFWLGEFFLGYDAYSNYGFYSRRLDHTQFVAEGGFLSFSDEIELNAKAWGAGLETSLAPLSAGLGVLLYKPAKRYAIPYIDYWDNRLRRREIVTSQKVSQSASRMGLAAYNTNLLKHNRYKAYTNSIRQRYKYFQASEEFQQKLYSARLTKERYLSAKPILGIPLKYPHPISALHRSTAGGRKMVAVIDDIVTPNTSDESWKALDDLISYFGDPKKDFGGPWKELDEVLQAGYQADARLPYFEKYLKQYDRNSFFDPSTKERVVIKLEFPVVEKGIVLKEKRILSLKSRSDLELKQHEAKQVRASAFATTPAEEYARESGIYKVLDKWAVKHRYLQLARDKLSLTENLSLLQSQYLQKLDDVFLNPNLKPRGDAKLHLLKREILSEKLDIFKSEKASKRILGDDYESWQSFTHAEKGPSLVGKTQTFLFQKSRDLLSIGFVVGGFAVYKRYFAYGPAAVRRAEFEAIYRKIGRWDFQGAGVNGFTQDEFNCAKEGRFFLFMLCYNSLAMQEVDPITLGMINLDRTAWLDMRSETSEAESFQLIANNAKVKEILRNYAYKMLRLRKMFRSGELFELSNRILEESIDDFSKTEFARIVDKYNPENPELSTRILEILSVPDNFDGKAEQIQKLLKELSNDYNPVINDFEIRYTDLIHEFLDNKSAIVSSVTNKARLTRYLENNLHGISYEEANRSAKDIERESDAERAFSNSTGGLFGTKVPGDPMKFEPEEVLSPAPESDIEASEELEKDNQL